MKFLFTLIFSLGLYFQAQAQFTCADVHMDAPISAYQKRNQELSEKYPKFKAMLSDPQKYFNEMSRRFENQKSLTPDSPYDFEFTDWALPLLSDMHQKLQTKKETLSQELTRLKSNRLQEWWSKKKISDIQLGLEFYDRLLAEIETYQSKGAINYRETFEISYFYSRAAGLLDISVLKLLNLRDRMTVKLDELTEGYEEKSIREEFNRYLERKVSLFDKKTPISTWQAAAEPFNSAVFNKDKLEVLILPTTEFLGRDIFIHLLSSEIYLVGVAAEPTPADGYVRPSGLFFVHDLRHSSFMYYRNWLYKTEHDLTREQIDELSRMMSEYVVQFDAELKNMKDRELAGAIKFYLFNQHHDGGYHLSPSNYLKNNAYHAPFILYVQLKLAGQKPGFNSIRYLPKARKWVEEFWLKHVADEKQMIEKFHSQNLDKKK